ncbi:conserved protein of unknown function [Listeria monocytogenes]|nr:conserved protein of unknown function [Listeria monocytogenes]GAT42147.1 conserved protein of unknown function [Listeria monocytogenes]
MNKRKWNEKANFNQNEWPITLPTNSTCAEKRKNSFSFKWNN